MRKKLKNFKNKNGHSENGAPRQLVDEATYRESASRTNSHINNNSTSPHWNPQYSGMSNATRPRDHAIFMRSVQPIIPD